MFVLTFGPMRSNVPPLKVRVALTINPPHTKKDTTMEYLTPKDFEDNDPLSTLSRRLFIKGLGFVSVSLLVGTMGGCDKLADAIKNRPVRRRLRTGSAEVDADINT